MEELERKTEEKMIQKKELRRKIKNFFYNRKIQKRSRQKDYRKRFGTE